MRCQICQIRDAAFRCETVMLQSGDLSLVPAVVLTCQSCANEGMQFAKIIGQLLGVDFPFSMTLDSSLKYRREPLQDLLDRIDMEETFARWEAAEGLGDFERYVG